jgi:hypothetical protein
MITYITKHLRTAIGSKPTSDVGSEVNDGVVALLAAASRRQSCTEEEREELVQMAKRLRESKQKILDEKAQTQEVSMGNQIRQQLIGRETVDDYREYHLDIDINEKSDNRQPESDSSDQTGEDRMKENSLDGEFEEVRLTDTYFFNPSDD